jgi:hypothetical protein
MKVLGVDLKQLAFVSSNNDMCYFQFALNCKTIRNIGRNKSLTGGILLPKLCNTGLPSSEEEKVYTLIDSEWNYLSNKDGKLQ